MEHRIGEIITLKNGRRAKVVPACTDCEGCIFYPYNEWDDDDCVNNPEIVCIGTRREDGTDIVYKEIEEE